MSRNEKINYDESSYERISVYDMLFNYDKIEKDFNCPKCKFSCLSRRMYDSHCCNELLELSIIDENAKNCQKLEKEITDTVDSNISTETNDMGTERNMGIDENINEKENNHEKRNLEKMKVASSVNVTLFDVLKFPLLNMGKQEEVERNRKRSISESNNAIKSNDIGNGENMSIDKKIKGEEINYEKRSVEESKAESHMNEVGIYGKSSKNDTVAECNNGIKSDGISTVEDMSRNEKINYDERNYERKNLKEIKAETPHKVILSDFMSRNEKINYEESSYERKNLKEIKAKAPHKVVISDFHKSAFTYMRHEKEVKIHENSSEKEILKDTDILKVKDLRKNSKGTFGYSKINNVHPHHSVVQKNNPQQKKHVNAPVKSFIRKVASKKTYGINNIDCNSANFKKWDAVSSKEILTRNKLQSISRDHDYTDSIKLSPKAAATVVVHSRASQEIKKKVNPVNKKEINRTKDSVAQKTKELNRNKHISFSDPLIETPVSASEFHLQKNKDDDEKEKTAINSSGSEKESKDLVLYESIHNDFKDDKDHTSYEFYLRYEEVLNERKTLINHDKCSASITDIILNYHKISKDFMCAQCHFSCLTRRMYDSHSCDEYMKTGKGRVKKENIS